MDTENGTVVTFRKRSRSTEQSAKMWAMLHEVATQVDWYGQKIAAEDWKDMFTASLRHARVVPGIDKGPFVPLGMHTSTMTIEEMTNLIELIYAFGAEHNVVFKDPRQEEQPNPADHSPDDQPGSGYMSPSPETDEAGDSPSTLASSPLSEAKLRQHLMDFARKALTTASDAHLTTVQRTTAIEQMLASYRSELTESLWSKLSGVMIAIPHVITGKRTADEARAYIARDVLDCQPSEIGGAA
jgi:hypothetical protein